MTARYPLAHGTPVHIGDPVLIGVTDLTQSAEQATGTDMNKVYLKPGEIATFTPAGASYAAFPLFYIVLAVMWKGR